MLNDVSILFLIISFACSLGIAALIMMLSDGLKARMNINKIVGTPEEDKKRMKVLMRIVDTFSFNHEENRKKLISAGIYSEFIAKSYYLFKIIPFSIAFIVITWLFIAGKFELDKYVLYLSLATMFFLLALDMFVGARAKKITKRVSGRLPFLLDLMNVCVHTGMTIESSLDYLAKEISTVDQNLAYAVKMTVERSRLVGIEKAINEFVELVPTSEAQSFAMTLTQSLQYGSSVGPVLSSLASDIREINIMELEEKIGKLGAQMSIPLIVFIMVPIVVLIAAPGIVRMFNA
ncbi:type II secretion system F family protein [uncultured Photobacterium sp.]|uniref:type II secretion system F family protein n=1 Tax=uncultured Photobacterium sp. TaxID=173973 RepID=UPI00260AD1A6|nr:type II secretion system F family protein [uncultured Photobacterium sp.]